MNIPVLKKGDKIAIVSTARKIEEQEVLFAKSWFEEAGLEVVYGKNLFGENNQFSGTDDERAKDFQWAIDDDSIKAVICARGGYGTVRLLPLINFDNFVLNPKWVIGYSDVTVLHSYINSKLNLPTVHATMPINFKNNSAEALNSLKNVLFGRKNTYQFGTNTLNKTGHCEGEIVGGNLSIIYSLMGTNAQLKTKGKILFLEDLDEYLYHIDRMMQNLKLAGLLNDLSGLVVGGMTDMNDNAIPFGKNAQEIILECVQEFNYPVCFDFPSGHIDDNRAIVLNKKANLKVGSKECLFTQ